MDRRTAYELAERLNILEDERRLAAMNGEEDNEPEEGDLDASGRFVYTQTGMTDWGTPVMRWKPWGIR